MKSFKGFVLRWMVNAAQLCPWTKERILSAIRTSAEAAVETCTGGENGRMCGMRWETREHDGYTGLGQETSVLSALMTLLVESDAAGDSHPDEHGLLPPPVTLSTGGTSQGDPHAGESRRTSKPMAFKPIEQKDVIGAAILTCLLISGGLAMCVFMCWDAGETLRTCCGQEGASDLELQLPATDRAVSSRPSADYAKQT